MTSTTSLITLILAVLVAALVFVLARLALRLARERSEEREWRRFRDSRRPETTRFVRRVDVGPGTVLQGGDEVVFLPDDRHFEEGD